MNFRWATVLTMVAVAGLSGWLIPAMRVFYAVQPLLVLTSIMAAAIFVRLNRAMPTLDWKSLEPAGRKKLTRRVVELNQEYLSILLIQAVLAAALIALVMTGRPAIAVLPDWAVRTISAVIGGLMSLALFRMGYVAWRDYDIVKLQKELIDAAGDKEFAERQVKAAEDNAAAIQSAGLRPFEQKPPSDWH